MILIRKKGKEKEQRRRKKPEKEKKIEKGRQGSRGRNVCKNGNIHASYGNIKFDRSNDPLQNVKLNVSDLES